MLWWNTKYSLRREPLRGTPVNEIGVDGCVNVCDTRSLPNLAFPEGCFLSPHILLSGPLFLSYDLFFFVAFVHPSQARALFLALLDWNLMKPKTMIRNMDSRLSKRQSSDPASHTRNLSEEHSDPDSSISSGLPSAHRLCPLHYFSSFLVSHLGTAISWGATLFPVH